MQGRFVEALAERKAKGQYRKLRAFNSPRAGFVSREGREYIDFSSNDYLGLSRHALLAQRAGQWAQEMGTGARASRLVSGTLDAHCEIERKIAAFKDSEAALLFASGWQANAAIFPALLSLAPNAAIFADRLVHASIHHGIAASGQRQIRFRHNDLDHLEQLLARRGGDAEARFIVTESVFSMDGDRCDLARLSQIAQAHDAFLIVDEAHATGVLGEGGAGLCAALPRKPDLVMGTFSKAMGSFGAYVAGSAQLCDYLVNTCSGLIYSTALPPPVLGAIDAALDLVPGMEAERRHLAGLAAHLRDGLRDLGYDTLGSDTQIVPLVVGAETDALELSGKLEGAGFVCTAIRPPTVAKGTSRLRIALSSAHSAEQVDALLNCLADAQ